MSQAHSDAAAGGPDGARARLRVLHVTDRLSGRGGAHRHLLGVIEAQVRAAGAAHGVHLAAGRDDGGAACACPVELIPGLEARTRDTSPLPGLERSVRRLRPDIVHVHTVVNPAVLEWAQARPAVVTVQDHRYFCPTRGKWTLDGQVCRAVLEHRTCRACFEDGAGDYFEALYALTSERLAALRGLHVTVLSEYMRAELLQAGLRPARVSVTPPFVHGLDPAAAPDGPPCVLFAGRLTAAKGVHDAVAAWRRAQVAAPLVFAGTGPLRAELEHGGFEVLGWLAPRRLSAAYRRATALLLPSRWQEPCGIVGLEALAFGVPVVAWDSGGIREWHPGRPELCAWGDVDGLARGLREALGAAATPQAARPGFDRTTSLVRLAHAYAAARAG